MRNQWYIGSITSEYLSRLEDVIHLNRFPLDEKRPVICFDEMPVQLLGEVVAPLPMKKDQPSRCDYEYQRVNGLPTFPTFGRLKIPTPVVSLQDAPASC